MGVCSRLNQARYAAVFVPGVGHAISGAAKVLNLRPKPKAKYLSVKCLYVCAYQVLTRAIPDVQGYVVRRAATGVGIEWLEFAPELVQFLAQYLTVSSTSKPVVAVTALPHPSR